MEYMIDLDYDTGLEIKVFDEGNIEVKANEINENGNSLTFELYGEVGAGEPSNSDSQIDIDEDDIRSRTEYGKIILCVKVEDGWKIKFTKNNQPVDAPGFILWKKMDRKGDDCSTVGGVPVCWKPPWP